MRLQTRLSCLLTATLAAGSTLFAQDPAAVENSTPDWAELASARLPGLEICRRPNLEEPLLCGSFEVPEDRSLADGRTIALNLVVVPAQRPTPPSDAVFIFEGGPGGAVTKRAVGSVYSGPVRQRDIVLVDQRGTGGSGSIDCDLGGGTTRDGELKQMFPPAEVAACVKELSKRADLQRYTSVDHAADIEAVRKHLGYGPINLRGGSYGTRAMMVYAQLYPESTRTLFGIGVDSPLRSNLAERGTRTEIALAGLSSLCEQDADCAALVPSLAGQLERLAASLESVARRVELADPGRPGETLALDIGRDWFTEQLRLNLYFAFTSRALPWAVHRATEGDWEPIVQMAVLIQRSFKSALSAGVVLTVQCSEHMDFDIDDALATGEATLFGNYRLEQQLQGCAAWPHTTLPPLGVAEPEALPMPTLWLSGALDPVTPPAYAEDAMTYFPNSRHLVLPEGQHGPFDLENSWECVHSIWGQLIDLGSLDGLDASCSEAMRRPGFILDRESFAKHLAEVLVPMAQ